MTNADSQLIFLFFFSRAIFWHMAGRDLSRNKIF